MENYKQAACQTARLRHSAGNTGGRGVRGKSLPFRRRLAAASPRHRRERQPVALKTRLRRASGLCRRLGTALA